MKKDIVFAMLLRLENQSRKMEDEVEQTARLAAIQQCRAWVELPWVKMLEVVQEKLQSIQAERHPLVVREMQEQLPPDERARLTGLVAAESIYVQFRTKIASTALRALTSQLVRRHEKTAQSIHQQALLRQLQLESRISSAVEEHGFFIMLVFDPEDQRRRWGYTIGLHHTNPTGAEIIIIGLPMPNIEGMLRIIASKMLKEQVVFEAGQTRSDLTEGDYPCFFASVDPMHYEDYVGQGMNYYAGQPFPLLQCVWSDTKKRFPWEPGFQEKFRPLQPLLFDVTQYVTE